MNPTTNIMDSTMGLYRDRRGAVLMMAVFMAAFLVGGLWYIIGIGDAILYRQRMQDGADAVAFAAAVYHARGMNIIAMINIIMAAILGVLVALKLLQLMNWIAMAISCALSWTGVGAAVCGVTKGLDVPISKAVQAAEKMVKAVLPVLSKTQMGIAVAMPWVAEAKAVYIASNEYKKPVNTGGIISVSLIPFVPKERLGLPVQEDEYKFLCKKAGQFVGNFVFMPFGKFGSWVGGVIGNLVSSFPSYFCADSGGSSGGGGNSGGGGFKGGVDGGTMDKLAKDSCKEKYDDLKKKGKEKGFDFQKCEKDTKKDLQKSMDEKNKSSSSSTMNTKSMTSKRVFDKAENGNNYFQIWSIVVGDEAWPKKADKGVKIAAWNKANVKAPMPWGKVGFAQAEFYYDTSTPWSKIKEDAMWNMRWRARLRRVRPLNSDTGSWLSGGVLGKIGGAVAGAMQGADVIGSILGGTGIGGDLGNVLQDGSSWMQDKESDLMQIVDGFQVIH